MPVLTDNTQTGSFQAPEWLQSLMRGFANSPTTIQGTQAGQPMQQGYEQTVASLDPMGQANQNIKQQVAPPAGPLASKEMKPDGTVKETYHPPVEQQQPPAGGGQQTQTSSTPPPAEKQAQGSTASAKQGKTVDQPNGGMIANKNFMGFGGVDAEGNLRDTGTGIKILQLLSGGGVASPSNTALKVQETRGKKPVQPLEAVSAKAGIYSTQLSSFDKQIASEESSVTAMIQEQQNLIRNRILGVGTPANIKRYGELQRQIDASRQRLFGPKGLMELKGQILAQPPAVQQGSGSSSKQGSQNGVTQGSFGNITWKLKGASKEK